MNILIYLAVYIGYLGICAAVVYSLRRCGQTISKPEFSESFSPVKGAVYFAVYWLVTVFAAKLLALSKNTFLIENSDFFAYLFLAIVGAGLFYRFFCRQSKTSARI